MRPLKRLVKRLQHSHGKQVLLLWFGVALTLVVGSVARLPIGRFSDPAVLGQFLVTSLLGVCGLCYFASCLEVGKCRHISPLFYMGAVALLVLSIILLR